MTAGRMRRRPENTVKTTLRTTRRRQRNASQTSPSRRSANCFASLWRRRCRATGYDVKKGRRSGVAVGLDANRLDRGLHIVLTATLEPPGRGAGGAYIGYPGPTTGSARWSARSGSAASPAPARRGRQGSMRRFPSRLSRPSPNVSRPSPRLVEGSFRGGVLDSNLGGEWLTRLRAPEARAWPSGWREEKK